MINIIDAVNSTWIFAILLGIALILSIRVDKKRQFFPISTTEELKGFAILAVVFAHIGYFLVNDDRFLFPLSIISGVAVDIFLFLSGFGVTVSSLKNRFSIISFYVKRLPRLFIPFWIILIVFLVLDFFILKISYPWQTVFKDFLGIFTRADIYHDINSPFWYFTLILFYYLAYPLIFNKKMPWVSAFIIYIISYLIVFQWNPTTISEVRNLYSVHLLPFPLGMAFAWGFSKKDIISNKLSNVAKAVNNSLFRYFAMAILLFVCVYTAIYSGVGNNEIVGYISTVTVLSIFFLFILKKFDIKLLGLFGIYSYEIYLMHWPIMYRYDIFYKYMPAWLATALYLILFIALAWILQKLTDRILKREVKKVKYLNFEHKNGKIG